MALGVPAPGAVFDDCRAAAGKEELVKILEFCLENLAGGDAGKMFDEGVARVLENIADQATPAEASRRVTLELTISPSEDRTRFVYDVGVKVKVQDQKVQTGNGYLSHTRDGLTASLVDPEQLSLEDAVKSELGEGVKVTLVPPVPIRKGGSA